MNAIQSANEMTQATLDLLKGAVSAGAARSGDPRILNKSISQATGLTWYDLQKPAKSLFPVITPLRNRIPRVPGGGDVATRWKAVTAINTTKLRGGVPEGMRNGVVSMSVISKLQAYKTIGLEDYSTFEAVNAAVNFEDIRARMGQNLLWATMIQEEKIMFGGNSDTGVALGTTPTPTAANAASGGSIAAGTYNVICVALTHAGWDASSVAGGVPLQQTVTMPNGQTFNYNPGTAIKSAASSTTTTGSTSTISASVAPVNGAVAYAWFVGTAGSERLQVITTINSVLLTSLSTTTQLASAGFTADLSKNDLEFDGLLTQALIPGSGANVITLATGTPGTGTKLTCSAQDASIDQIEALNKAAWDNQRLAYDVYYVNAQELANITSIVMKNGGSPIVRLNGDFSNGVNGLAAGAVVGTYLNRYGMNGGKLATLALHPNAAPGTILAHVNNLPYPISEVPNVCEVRYRQDYYQLEWPITQRRYEAGVYADMTLAHYFPGAIGVITNIANGV